MNARLLLWAGLVNLSAALYAATAPTSVAGMVYSDSAGAASLGVGANRTLVLHRDGTYTFLLYYPVQVAGGVGPVGNTLYAPPADGTYTYAVAGEAKAQLELTAQTGTTATIELSFTGEDSGTAAYTRVVMRANPGANEGFSTGMLGAFRLRSLSGRENAATLNVSLRGTAGAGRPLIAGFVVPPGQFGRTFLIRVVGPSLARFGVTGAWANPEFVIHRGTESALPRGPWYYPDNPTDVNGVAALQKVSTYAGAFPLESGSKDALGIITLTAGAGYTVVCQPGNTDPGGDALIEVYALPP
jgi:hypothetical protein